MDKLKLSYISILLVIVLAPACKKKKSSISSSPVTVTSDQQKNVDVFDNDLEAFVIDEDESAFGPHEGYALVDESENDIMVEQSRQGFMPIYFEFDADCMKPAQTGAMENNLARAKKLVAQGKKIVIEGHACKYAGSPEYNMQLSEKRARCVYNYFIKNGIPKDKIRVVGRGNEMCMVHDGSKEQQAPNRRVEFAALSVE